MRTRALARRRPVLEQLETRRLLATDVVASSANAAAAFDAFLQIDGIPGDSSDLEHGGTIEIDSFSWGATQSGSLRPSRSVAEDFSFVSSVSSASPDLFKAAATGQHIKKAVLFVRKAGGDQQDYLKVTLEDVLVSSVQGRSLNDSLPLEEVSFRFSRIQEDYRPTLADGTLGDPVTAAWDTMGRWTVDAQGPTLLDQQPFIATGQVDAFLQITGIPGESTDAKHKDWIEIESFSWGLSNSASGLANSAGRLAMQDFHFVTPISTASPLLMGSVATGKHISKAVLTLRRDGPGDEVDFLTYKMEDVLVSSFQTQSVDSSLPMEEFTLNFNRLTQSYVGPDPGTGLPPERVTATWGNSDRRALYQMGESILDQTKAPGGSADSSLDVAGVQGESVSSKHKDTIEIESFSWGASRPVVSRGVGGGAGAGKVSVQDFHFVAPVDKSSPDLMLAAATGEHIKKAVLYVRKSGGDSNVDFLTYKLSDLLVSSYQMQSVDESLPLNEFAFRFKGVQEAYTQPASDGRSLPAVQSRWNVSPLAIRATGEPVLDDTASVPYATDAFLEIAGIPGESVDDKHRDTIEVSSFSWGVTQAGSYGAGGGGGAGRLALEPFHFVTPVSEASPPLLARVLSGQHLSKATLYVRKAGAADDYLKIKLTDILVSSYQTQSLDQKFPLDEVTLKFGRLAQDYQPPDEAGKPAPPVQADFVANPGRNAFATGGNLLDITTPPAQAAALYIKFDGVDGDASLGGAVEVQSYSWGVSNSGSLSAGGGGGAGKVSMQDFHFVAAPTQASPELMLACATGKHYQKVELHVARGSGDPRATFLKYELENVLVSSYQTAAHSGALPLEEMTLNFTGLEQQYASQEQDPTVPAGPPVVTQWSNGRPQAVYSRGNSILEDTTAQQSGGQIYLAVAGIPGEPHKGELEIESYSWGMSQAIVSRGAGGGGGSGKVSMQDFHFVANLSQASPQLLDAVAKGKHFPDAVLTVRKSGAEPRDFLKYKLTDVMVSSYQAAGSGDTVPTDNFSLNFAKVEFEYVPPKSSGQASSAASVDAVFATV